MRSATIHRILGNPYEVPLGYEPGVVEVWWAVERVSIQLVESS